MAGTLRERESRERIVARVRSILGSRRLTLHQVSELSRRLYGPESRAFIPHTLYHSIANSPSFGTSLAQTCALSRITGYRLADWLVALGIDLEAVAGLQALLPVPRTRLIDSHVGPFEWIAQEPEVPEDHRHREGVIPLGHLIHQSSELRSEPFTTAPQQPSSRFARIGSEDALAFPELLPGSIVRAIPRETYAASAIQDRGNRPQLLLIEHERGFWCGRFHVSQQGLVHAVAPELAYAPIVFQCPREARILGAVDMELRWLDRFLTPRVPPEFATFSKPPVLVEPHSAPGRLIRRARSRAGLTLREASQLSRDVSQRLRDKRYLIAESSLSEYEAQDELPRHLEKVVTLGLIYGIGLLDFAIASGTLAEELGHEAIPAEFLTRRATAPFREPLPATGETPSLPRASGQIARLYRDLQNELQGNARTTLRDFFWLNGQQPYLPRYTEGSWLALVNRRKKKPARLPSLPAWQQPAFMLLLRNGKYLCACCSLDSGTLMLHPESQSLRVPEPLRLGRDVEVIGQIVALARKIA
jgi:hypothetical protein